MIVGLALRVFRPSLFKVYRIMKIKEVPFADLSLNRNDIYLMMGSGSYVPDAEMIECIEERIARIAQWCRPRYGYELFQVTDRDARSICLDGEKLTTGGIITRYLEDAEFVAVFVATAGEEFEKWLREEARSGDILREFIAANIGSEIAEAANRAFCAAFETNCAPQGLHIGNPYSPGYCGWNITDQRTLFSMLPPAPCGVRLNDSCLMTPIKSVSGIIPVGRYVRKEPYGCAICNSATCYKNNLKK